MPEPGPAGLQLQLDSEQRAQVEAALAKKDYKSAEAVLVEEADKQPKSARAANLLEFAGGIFFLDREYLNSAIAFKKAEAIAPLRERSRFTLAMAYIELGRPQWARAELERLSISAPGNALYLYWLARLDYDGHKYTEALSRLQKVTALDPAMVRAHDLLGLCYDYMGDQDKAIASFERAVQLNRAQARPSPWPHLDMAVSQVEIGRLKDAENNLREAVQYDPGLPRAHYELGRVLDQEGKTDEAVQELKAASADDPNYPEPHYLLGRIYHRLGKDELAKSEVQQFQKLQMKRH
ncbi:MAG TPA: tetratricopeptide repeat protein [Terriglobales bacterium]|nr:tetratricopeptide repeat protein [Terriglobales bacterium]